MKRSMAMPTPVESARWKRVFSRISSTAWKPPGGGGRAVHGGGERVGGGAVEVDAMRGADLFDFGVVELGDEHLAFFLD
ncbi:MAG: hypothetical protein ABIH66_02255, partial [bacterium]